MNPFLVYAIGAGLMSIRIMQLDKNYKIASNEKKFSIMAMAMITGWFIIPYSVAKLLVTGKS